MGISQSNVLRRAARTHTREWRVDPRVRLCTSEINLTIDSINTVLLSFDDNLFVSENI